MMFELTQEALANFLKCTLAHLPLPPFQVINQYFLVSPLLLFLFFSFSPWINIFIDLEYGTTYYVEIAAGNAFGWSDWLLANFTLLGMLKRDFFRKNDVKNENEDNETQIEK